MIEACGGPRHRGSRSCTSTTRRRGAPACQQIVKAYEAFTTRARRGARSRNAAMAKRSAGLKGRPGMRHRPDGPAARAPGLRGARVCRAGARVRPVAVALVSDGTCADEPRVCRVRRWTDCCRFPPSWRSGQPTGRRAGRTDRLRASPPCWGDILSQGKGGQQARRRHAVGTELRCCPSRPPAPDRVDHPRRRRRDGGLEPPLGPGGALEA